MADEEAPRRPRHILNVIGEPRRDNVETFEENSENYEGPELQQFRARRAGTERMSRLEQKYDDLSSVVAEIKTDVKAVVTSNATMVGKFETFMALQQDRRSHPESLMRVVQETTTATLATRVLDEREAAQKFRRKFVLSTLKIVGGLVSAGGVGALAHWLLEKL